MRRAPELIAAFVRPNDPAIDAILRNAADKLAAANAPRELDGYRSKKRTRALQIAAAIWAALLDERIVYALPPQSFERDGQKVRSPSDILARKVATCLDTTLLFAAAMEQAGLIRSSAFWKGTHSAASGWSTTASRRSRSTNHSCCANGSPATMSRCSRRRC